MPIHGLSNASSSPAQLPPGADKWPVDKYFDADFEAYLKIIALGYDIYSCYEQKIVWGDHDSFQHVNNVHYLRFFESSRIEWMQNIGLQLGGKSKADKMIKAKGISLILKSVSINYKRPVTFPDTLLIVHKPHIESTNKYQFNLSGLAYSYTQRAIVCDSESVLVWYDYDKLKKCDPGEKTWKVLRDRIEAGNRKDGKS